MIKYKPYLLNILILLPVFNIGCFHTTGLEQTSVVAEMLPENDLILPDRRIGLNPKSKSGDYYLGNDFIHVSLAYNDACSSSSENDINENSGSIIDASYLEIDNTVVYENEAVKYSKIISKTEGRISALSNAMGYLSPVISNNMDFRISLNKQFEIEKRNDYTSIIMRGEVLDLKGYFGKLNNPIEGIEVIHIVRLGRLDAFITLITNIINHSGHSIDIKSIGDKLKQKPNNQGYHLCLPSGDTKNICLNSNRETIASQNKIFSLDNLITTSVPGLGLIDLNHQEGTKNINANLWILPLDNECLYVTYNTNQSDKDIYPDTLLISNIPNNDLLLDNASITYSRRIYILPSKNDSHIRHCQLFNQIQKDRSFFDIINSMSNNFIRYGMKFLIK